MLRPTSLYRSDSRRQPNLEANASNINEGSEHSEKVCDKISTLMQSCFFIFVDSIDCGVTALGMCNSPKCQKMASKRTFMIVLISCGFIQGAIEMYFRISAKQAALTHDYNLNIVGEL